MPTIALSESAVASLRFRIRGYPVRDQDRPACAELVDAGIMEPDGAGGFRFTEYGLKHREEILEGESDRIERERCVPPHAGEIPEPARALLRRLVSGKRVAIDPSTLVAYRGMAAARVGTLISGFATGPESGFRFTYWGWKLRHELAGIESENGDA